jgi:hypothetical protein
MKNKKIIIYFILFQYNILFASDLESFKYRVYNLFGFGIATILTSLPASITLSTSYAASSFKKFIKTIGQDAANCKNIDIKYESSSNFLNKAFRLDATGISPKQALSHIRRIRNISGVLTIGGGHWMYNKAKQLFDGPKH